MASSKHILIGVFLLLGTACGQYLDVKPKDHYLQERVFNDIHNIELAKRGIYSALAADELYGGTLTMGALDVMGQYYPYPENKIWNQQFIGTHIMHGIGSYNYTDSYAVKTFASTWEATYAVILNINSFIAGLKDTPGVLSEVDYNLQLGEAYGLRAYVHFDLLRLFGPVYGKDPDAPAIPYHVSSTPRVQPIRSAAAVGKLVMADLDSAAACLSVDPIREAIGNDGDSQRFNYFAVMATYARVCLYLGDRERAAQYVETVLEEGKRVFGLSADGKLDAEVIYGLTVANLAAQHQRYFAPSPRPDLQLIPAPDVLMEVYGGNIMDLRYQHYWTYYPSRDGRMDAFQKYAPPAKEVPLLRLSELYFMMAECTSNEELAVDYLRQVARNRNEIIPDAIRLPDALYNAYRREFWGEGQLFFYCKRVDMAAIPSGSGSGEVVSMTDGKYQVPIPKNEMIYR